MKIVKHYLVLIILNFFHVFSGYSQSSSLYIATDQPFYKVDENIYFKVYKKNNGNEDKKSIEFFAIQLIDEKKNVIHSQVFQLISNIGAGQLFLPDSVEGGSFSLIAFPENTEGTIEYFAQKQIEILNPYLKSPHSKSELLFKPSKNTVSKVVFFPEGGKLLDGLAIKVGLKTSDNNDNSIQAVGTLESANGVKITDVTTKANGIGSFTFTPKKSENYRLKFVYSDSTIKTYDLPSINENGLLLSLKDSVENFLTCKIQSTNNSINEKLSLTVQAKGETIYSEVIDLEKGRAEKNILKKNLPSGLIKFSIQNNNKQVLKEQYFINQENSVKPEIMLSKSLFAPREIVQLEIRLNSDINAIDSANLSVSVLDKSQVEASYTTNLSNTFLYLSEIKELIEPEIYYSIFYHNNDTDELNLALSSITEVKSFQTPQIKRKDGTRILQGTVSDKNGHPSAYASIILTSKGELPLFQYTSSDAKGNFSLPIDIENTTDATITALSSSDKNEDLVIKTSANKTDLSSVKINLPIAMSPFKNYYVQKLITSRIEEQYKVFDSTKSFSPSEKKKIKNEFEISANTLIELSKFQSFSTMKEVIQEIVPGFKFKKVKDVLELRLLDLNRKIYYKDEPLYFIDNTCVPNLDYILDLDPSIVENVVVIGDPHNLRDFGPLALNGIFAIHTIERNYLPKGVRNTKSLKLDGMNNKNIIYSPKANLNSRIPDFRSLLYWNPTVITNGEGRVTVSFYNSDAVGPKEITVEGVTKDGTPIYGTYTYEVKLRQ
jgi:hypothetical protein